MTLRLPRPIRKTESTTPYDVVIRWCLTLAVFFVPIFFLPFSTDPLEINKALLFYVLVLIAGVAWLLKLMVRREGGFVRTPFDLLLALFVLLNIFATIFSAYRYHSLVGVSNYLSSSLVSVLFFAFFFYLIVENIRQEHLPRLLYAFLLSGAVVVAFNFLQVFGLFVFPWSFAQVVTFNAVSNSSLAFSAYVAILGVLSFMKLQRATTTMMVRILLGFLSVLALFLLLAYDHPVGWYLTILGLVLFLIFSNTTSRRLAPSWLLTSTILIGIALIALFINTQSLLQASLPRDITLPVRDGAQILWKSAQQTPLFGSGQATFDLVFGKDRPLSFNDTSLWQLRFLRSSNEWFQLVPTVGVLATLSFLGMVVLFLFRIFRAALRLKPDDPAWRAGTTTLIGGTMVVAVSIFSTFNFFLAFLFWLFLAVGTVVTQNGTASDVKVADRKTGSSFAASLSFSLVVILGIVFLYFAGRFWYADVLVARANAAIAKQEQLDTVRASLSRSIELNPYEQSTYFDLAQNFLVQAQLGAQAEKPDVNQLRTFISGSVAAAQSGVDRYASYGGTYEAVSTIYRDIDALTGAISEETLQAFTKATELEPKNPQLLMNLGSYYLAVAQKEQQTTTKDGKPDEAAAARADEALVKAKEVYTRATTLKRDFLDAQLNIALVLRLQKKGTEAVTMLEDLAAKNALDTDVLFNLAENYRIDQREDDALELYQRIVSIFPGHSDAHFRLAEIYEQKGQIDQAIAELETVKRLNPDNKDVADQLKTLKEKK